MSKRERPKSTPLYRWRASVWPTVRLVWWVAVAPREFTRTLSRSVPSISEV